MLCMFNLDLQALAEQAGGHFSIDRRIVDDQNL
jgi:hypothetical protein